MQKELKNKKDEIVKDILKAKHEAKDYRTQGYNFEVFTKYNDYLYDLFIEKSKKLLNTFTIKDSQLKVWCYFTGLGNHIEEDIWHNHTRTSTINSVIYLQTLKDHGIKFENKNRIVKMVNEIRKGTTMSEFCCIISTCGWD